MINQNKQLGTIIIILFLIMSCSFNFTNFNYKENIEFRTFNVISNLSIDIPKVIHKKTKIFIDIKLSKELSQLEKSNIIIKKI